MADDLFLRACRAYSRFTQANGAIPQQPSSLDSDVTHHPDGSAVITLANVRGDLATYRYDPAADRLRRTQEARP